MSDLKDLVDGSVYSSVHKSVGRPVWNTVWDSLKASVRYSVWNFLILATKSPVGRPVYDCLRNSVCKKSKEILE